MAQIYTPYPDLGHYFFPERCVTVSIVNVEKFKYIDMIGAICYLFTINLNIGIADGDRELELNTSIFLNQLISGILTHLDFCKRGLIWKKTTIPLKKNRKKTKI